MSKGGHHVGAVKGRVPLLQVEQSAFSPGNMVPGIEPSPDKMLQGRLFSYPDTHRHRLGANFTQLPINCPFATRVRNQQRDGPMCFMSQGAAPPYFTGLEATGKPCTQMRHALSL